MVALKADILNDIGLLHKPIREAFFLSAMRGKALSKQRISSREVV